MDHDDSRLIIDTPLLAWTIDDTKEYLDANPLPLGFAWKHRDGGQQAVQPSHGVKSYGKWLRETPYFQGLFEEIHRTIVSFGANLPDPDQLASELARKWPQRRFPEGGLTQKLF